MKNSIICIANHQPKEIKEFLTDIPLTFYKPKKKPKIYKNKHLVFNDIKLLGKAYRSGLITRTPILCTFPSALESLSVFANVLYADVEMQRNGYFTFKFLDKSEICGYLSHEWTLSPEKSPLLVISCGKSFCFGKKSEFAVTLGRLLVQLPSLVHMPLAISLFSSVQDKFIPFSKMLHINRIVNRDNKPFFVELNSILLNMWKGLQILYFTSGKKKKALMEEYVKETDKEIIKNLKHFHFFKKHLASHNIYDYLDDEDNINVVHLVRSHN